jgi:hypothetical protein
MPMLKLKIEIARYHNLVFGRVLNFPPSLLHTGKLADVPLVLDSTGRTVVFTVASHPHQPSPHLLGHDLDVSCMDDGFTTFSYHYNTATRAANVVECVGECVRAINAKLVATEKRAAAVAVEMKHFE